MITLMRLAGPSPWLALLLAACAGRGPASLSPAQSRAVADTVLALDSAMNRAVDGLDCGTGLGYIGDLEPLFVSGGHVVRDHASLLRMCDAMVAPRTGATFTTTQRHAWALSADAAYVVSEGRYDVRYRDGRTKSEDLVMTTIWARGPEGWRMVHLHESALPADTAGAQRR